MSNYEQALRHSKNHRKDKYCQQCGFSISDKGIKSYADITERSATMYYVGTRSGERLTGNFTNTDEAVDALRTLREQTPDYHMLDWMCVYTDKNMVLMRE